MEVLQWKVSNQGKDVTRKTLGFVTRVSYEGRDMRNITLGGWTLVASL